MDIDADSGLLYFWCIAAAMSVLALAFVLPRLLTMSRTPFRAPTRTASNLAIYRSQLGELDRELAAGLLGSDEHRRAKADLARRLLDETAEEGGAPVGWRRSLGIAMAIGIALPSLAFALYALFGEPGALRRTAPLDAGAALPLEATVATTRADLVAHLDRAPRDGRGWVLLARLDLAGDRFGDAAREYAKAVAVSTKVARDPDVWCEYADALGMLHGGSLEGRPRELIARALAIDGSHPKALEMAGSAAYEQRDYATAALHWRTLLAQMRTDSASRRDLAAALSRVEELAANDRDGSRKAGTSTPDSR